MTTTKSDLVNAVAEANGFAQNKSAEIVETLIDLIKTKLSADEGVLVSGFGKFCVKKKRERRGRDPATGEASGISIPTPSKLQDWDGLLKLFIEFCRQEVAPVLPTGDDFLDVLADAEAERSRNPIRVASVLKRKLLDEKISEKYSINNSFMRLT